MLESDEGRWLTYEEAGELLGISTQAARMLSKRRGWARRTPNAYGDRAQVLVPPDVIVHPRSASDAERTGSAFISDQPHTNGHDHLNVQVLELLRDQVETANRRADDDRARADRAEHRADQAEQKAAGLRADLVELRVSEKVAVARAKRATEEVADLRQRAERAEAERGRAHDRAARAEAETKARDQWGLGRRLAWALRGR